MNSVISYFIFSAPEGLHLKEETSRLGYSVHGKSNFTGKNAPVNGQISGRKTGPENGHVPMNSSFLEIELKLNGCDCRQNATSSRCAFVN